MRLDRQRRCQQKKYTEPHVFWGIHSVLPIECWGWCQCVALGIFGSMMRVDVVIVFEFLQRIV